MSGLKGIKTVRDFEVENKVVFLRLDLNVPMEKGKITDYTRIDATLPTINFLIEKGAKLVLASHLGRPKTSKDKEFSMEPVAKALTERLSKEVLLIEDPSAKAVKQLLHTLGKDQIILLENVRFEAGETENSEEFASRLASYTDIYINDAFGASHRAHATIQALPAMIPQRGIGFLIEKEIQMLDTLLLNPKRPYVAILGGAKVSDKIGVIEKLMDIVDAFIIGGAMAYTFLKAQGHSVGKSRVEDDKVKYARELLERIDARNKTVLLPVDHVVTTGIADTANASVKKSFSDIEMGVDIGPESIRNFSALIKEAGTIFWNGPMGVFETPEFSKGTFALAKVIAESKGMKIIGGGDSAAAAEQSGFADKMTHISTGGGASLEYLQGDKLPGLEVLRFKIR
ncbi:MAG: phosphoglycerate kinase [Bdellovibrionaceae bacterium]|nr:phosphoglycerate kinase [Pseudobdellovibrionaceae bacterium]